VKNVSWRILIVLGVLVIAAVLVVPTFKPSVWPHKQIQLGLDLKGGMHLVLEVQTEKAVTSTVERIRSEMRSLLREERVRHQGLEPAGKAGFSTTIVDRDDLEDLRGILKREYEDVEIESTTPVENGLQVQMALGGEYAREIKKQATEQALETIRNRIDQFGVNEPDIRIQGENRILVQLPGIEDTERAKELLGKTAQLEFKLLDEEHDLGAALNGDVPEGSEILYQAEEASKASSKTQPYLVQKRTVMTGAHLTDARVKIDQRFNEPFVSIEFDRKGARSFERITRKNVKKRLAIVLDDKVYSAPTIQEPIPGGEARITGNFTSQEAHDLAIILRAGALPAPVKIIEERTVGPSLGQDSIQKGLLSMLIGGILVLFFMALYYKAGGLVADFVLILNILLIGAGLAAFGATLTLPGIAGIILTIGMAVDANVIIYERIREELRLGKTPAAAIAAGFDRAGLTVLDANVTTLIAALVLFQFGTGPVKGFAVTLSLGVVASLFTALVISRLIFDYFFVTRRARTLSI